MPHLPLDTLLATPTDRVLALPVTARRRLASTPRASELVCWVLFCDPDPRVSAALARNGALPLQLVRALAREPHPGTRAAVAGRRSLAADMLTRLTADREPEVRRAVARRRGLAWPLRKQLLADPDELVRLTAAAWHRLPDQLLVRWASSSAPEERQLAAVAIETPEDVRCALARDPSWRVRRLLACHDPRVQPLEVLAALALAPELPGDTVIAELLVEAVRTRLDHVQPNDVPRSFIIALMRSPCGALREEGRRLAYAAKAAGTTAGAAVGAP